MIQLVIYWRDRALDAEAKLAEHGADAVPGIDAMASWEDHREAKRPPTPSWLRRKLGVD